MLSKNERKFDPIATIARWTFKKYVSYISQLHLKESRWRQILDRNSDVCILDSSFKRCFDISR